MRELDNKVYNVLFANNLNSIEKYEKLRDIVREAYDLGAKEERKAYETLFEGDSNLEGLLDDYFNDWD